MPSLGNIVNDSFNGYRSFLGSAVVATSLSAAWAALGQDSMLARFAPLLSVVALFICFLGWSAWNSEVRRDAAIAKASRAIEFTRSSVLHIEDDGAFKVTRSLSVKNSGSNVFTGCLDEKFAFNVTPEVTDWKADVRLLDVPQGKRLEKVYQFSYDFDQALPGYDKTLRTLCWGYQLRPYLGPGESAGFSYTVASPPGAESEAFSDTGSVLAVIISHSYYRLHYSLHGPAGSKFLVLEYRAYSPDGLEDKRETNWLHAKSRPFVDSRDSSLLRRSLNSPIPGYKYVCKYRIQRGG